MMELGKQIKKYRAELGISQDVLAERIYVTRQTISNWENDKNYPDINSLLRLSEVFHVSIDILIKGDVKKMKEEINQEIKREDRLQFEKMSNIFTILFFVTVLTPIPLVHYLRYAGLVIWAGLSVITFWFAWKVEKWKKTFDIRTYKEIVAFTEGTRLDEIEKAREEGKRPYQYVLLAVASGFITFVVAVLFIWLFK